MRRLRGFTMIEMAVVAAIILVLAAVAIASFGGFTKARKEASMEVTLMQVFASQRAYFTAGNNTYADSDFSALPEGISLVASPAPPSGPDSVSVALGADGRTLGMVMEASDGSCWYLAADSEGRYNFGAVEPPAPCIGASALDYLP